MIGISSKATVGLPLILILVASISLATIAASLLTETDEYDVSSASEDLENIINDTLTEITTYLKITDAVGKYYETNNTQKIEKIAIMIKPFVSCTIDLSDITIKLENNQDIKILTYQKQVESIASHPLFEHPLWQNVTTNTFGCIIVHDTDHSILQEHTIDDHTDMCYLIIPLPEEFSMKYKDTLKVSIFPATGIIKTLSLKAPLPTKHVVNFIWDT